jgi:hypothetical protein
LTGAVFAAGFLLFVCSLLWGTMQQSMNLRSHPASGCWSERACHPANRMWHAELSVGPMCNIVPILCSGLSWSLVWITANCWGMWELTPLKAKRKVSSIPALAPISSCSCHGRW